MNEAKLGQLPDENAPERDAIHVAVVRLIAGEDLRPGCKFKLKFNSTDVALRADYNENETVGIVDPFLSGWSIRKGQLFYGLLFPGTVTGMRHHWSHPVFDAPKIAVDEHEQWIREFAEKWNFDYDELISNALSTADWRYVTAQGIDIHSRDELGEDHDLFWSHLEAMMGRKFDENHRDGMNWSCSC
jgi:hypothetical protein